MRGQTMKPEELEIRIRKQREMSPRKSVKVANEVHEDRQRQVAEFIKNGGEIEVLDSRVSKKIFDLKADWRIRGND